MQNSLHLGRIQLGAGLVGFEPKTLTGGPLEVAVYRYGFFASTDLVMYGYDNIYIYIYICIYNIYIYIYIYIHVCVCVCARARVCACVCEFTRIVKPNQNRMLATNLNSVVELLDV